MLHRISKDNVFKINGENFIKIITELIKITFNKRKQAPTGKKFFSLYFIYCWIANTTHLLSTYKSV